MANWWEAAPIVQSPTQATPTAPVQRPQFQYQEVPQQPDTTQQPPQQSANWWDAAPVAQSPTNAGPQSPEAGAHGTAVSALSGYLNGVPIVGPALQAVPEYTAAAINTALNGAPFADNLARAQGTVQEAQAQHPYVTTGSQVAGGVANSLPLMVAAPEVFGMSKAPLGAKMLTGGITGASIGGGDAEVRSDNDPYQTAKGMVIGGLAGAGGPLISSGIGAGTRYLGNAVNDIRNMPIFNSTGAAASNLRAAITESGDSLQNIQNQTAGNGLTPMDVNSNLRQIGQKLVVQGGEGRAAITNMVNARQDAAPDIVRDAWDNAMGPVPNVKDYLDNLIQTAKTNGKTNFTNALQNAQPVDVSPVLQHIDNVVYPGVNQLTKDPTYLNDTQKALLNLRSQLAAPDGSSMLTDANQLHTVQSELRNQIDTLAKSPPGQDNLTAGYLNNARKVLVKQIDDATGGQYIPAQKQYATDMSIPDAFNRGLSIYKNPGITEQSLYNRPEYLADWVKNDASVPEIAAAKVGSRVGADNLMGSVRNAALKGETLPEVGFINDKLGILHGRQNADNLTQTMENQRTMANNNSRLTAGSDSGDRLAAEKYTAIPQPSNAHDATSMIVGAMAGHEAAGWPGMLAGLGVGSMNRIKQGIMAGAATARNTKMAQALTSTQALQQALAAAPQRALPSAGNVSPGTLSMLSQALAQQGGRSALIPTR
jgi:hypothetical protein